MRPNRSSAPLQRADILVAMVFVPLLLASCSATRTSLAPSGLPEDFPNHNPAEIGELLASGTDTLRTFRAVSSAAVATPDGSSQFTASIDQRRNDSVRVDVRVQFGIEAARILFTPDSLFVYDRIKKTLYYGDTESAGSLLPVPWRSPDLFLDILGLPSVDIDDTWTVEADSTRYYLTSGDGSHTLFVDPALWRIVRSEERDRNGALKEERTFLDFDRFTDVVLPRRIVIRRPTDRISATISHRSIILNPEDLDLTFEVPHSVRHVRID